VSRSLLGKQRSIRWFNPVFLSLLRDVLKDFVEPTTRFNRLEAQRERALNRGEIGRYFVDNHDSFWQPGRFGSGAAALAPIRSPIVRHLS
jgi:hypothetical protein